MHVLSHRSKFGTEISLKFEVVPRYCGALELIGQAGLGYSFDPLTADSSDEFADAVKAFM